MRPLILVSWNLIIYFRYFAAVQKSKLLTKRFTIHISSVAFFSFIPLLVPIFFASTSSLFSITRLNIFIHAAHVYAQSKIPRAQNLSMWGLSSYPRSPTQKLPVGYLCEIVLSQEGYLHSVFLVVLSWKKVLSVWRMNFISFSNGLGLGLLRTGAKSTAEKLAINIPISYITYRQTVFQDSIYFV